MSDAFTPAHLGGHFDMTQLDSGALQFLVERFKIQSMLDVGCGPGGMLAEARQLGLRVVGVDGDPAMAGRDSATVIHDYTTGPLDLGQFDLGWSVEFLEHVEAQYIPHFMATFQGCQRLFVTAALPGQGGYHHVNEQTMDYWQDQFAHYGFVIDDEATALVRQHSSMTAPYARNTGTVFQRERK